MNLSLKSYNTFGFDVSANEIVVVTSESELLEFIKYRSEEKYLILGGGSNILFTHDYPGVVVLNQIKGKEIRLKDENTSLLCAFSGENWHELVIYSIEHGLGGLENLSLIPGTVGAAPIQNIGAYGVELKDIFVSLEAIHLKTGEKRVFTKEDCKFGYRDSVFKGELKGQYFILNVTVKLEKKRKVDVSYGAITQILTEKGITNPQIKDVSEAVVEIRRSKLPDPSVIGNAGSFFKNPIISKTHYDMLRLDYPDIPSYPAENGVKVPAGWLIEACGWKGQRKGKVGVHNKQALVLVHYGDGKGIDIYTLSEEIKKSVLSTFRISLEVEVNII